MADSAMVSIETVSTAQAAPEGCANTDAQLLDKLVKIAKRWTDHNSRGLKVRLEIGKLINAHLGKPTDGRQTRNKSVIKRSSEMLHIDKSELHRIRWYSHFCEDDVESFWGDVPEAKRTWTKARKILPGLKSNEKKQPSSDEKKSAAITAGLFRSMKSMTKQLRTDNFTVDATQGEELIQEMKKLASALSNAIGTHFQMDTKEDIREDSVTGNQAPRGVLAETAA